MNIRLRGFISLFLFWGIVLMIAYLAWVYMADYKNSTDEFRHVSAGMPEQEVRLLLKEPYREFHSNEIATNLDLKGWAHDSWKGTGKVLIYVKSDVICYVYLDLSQKVEHVFIGGS